MIHQDAAIFLKKSRHAARHSARVPIALQEDHLQTRARVIKMALTRAIENNNMQGAYDALEKLITLRAKRAVLLIQKDPARETDFLNRYAIDCARLLRATERLSTPSPL